MLLLLVSLLALGVFKHKLNRNEKEMGKEKEKNFQMLTFANSKRMKKKRCNCDDVKGQDAKLYPDSRFSEAQFIASDT